MNANLNRTDIQKLVLAGVDSSTESRDILIAARAEARNLGANLRVVMTTSVPISMMAVPLPLSAIEQAANTKLKELLSEVFGPDFAEKVDSEVVSGSAARILIDESANADLLVIGSRGHGPVVGAIIGSVSQQCVAHAHCPVLVVRGERREYISLADPVFVG